jgi:CoA:oxalate CoA-transferase
MKSRTGQGPLKDLVVLDLTRVLAGPFGTMTLADMGARVIKVEHPQGGDDSRSFAPFVKDESAYFMSLNRGKESITLNLKHSEGKRILKELIPKVDVLVENFKPGTMKKLGLDYPELAKINPRLIYAASSGFGQTGPYSHLPAYDLIIQGMAGLQSITGPDAHHPTKVGSSMADILAGMFTVIGILAALRHRDATGEGQLVDVAMLDCVVATLENAVARYEVTGKVPHPMGNDHPSIAPFATFESADGFINIAAGNDVIWERFCETLGAPELARDSRYTTNGDRVARWAALKEQLAPYFRHRTTEEWITLFREARVPCGPINTIDKVVEDPQIQAREMILSVDHPTAGTLRIPGIPVKLSATPGAVRGAAPLLGEHQERVLQELLGMDSKDVQALREEGVF